MERNRPNPEDFEQTSKTPEIEKKPAIWKRFKKYGEIAALSALLSITGIKSGLAQEKGEKGEKEDTKTKIEQLQEKAANYIKRIAVAVKEKGESGKMRMTGMETTPIKRWTSPDKTTSVTIGYGGEKGDNPQWLTSDEGPKGEKGIIRFYDRGPNGPDGLIDRIVINRQKYPYGERQRVADNDMNTFGSIDNLAAEAEMTADLKPEDIKVYEIRRLANGEFEIRSVDFTSGDASELTGSEAESLAKWAQGNFTMRMEGVEQRISK